MSNNTIPPSGRTERPSDASAGKPRDLLPTPESYELPMHPAIGGPTNGLVKELIAAADPDHKLPHAVGPLAKVAASLGTTKGIKEAGGAFTALTLPKTPQ